MDMLAFIQALKAKGQTAEQIRAAVADYLEENPEAIDQAAVEALIEGKLEDIEDDVDGLKSAVADLESGSLSALDATAGQVPTADGEGSWEWATPSGGGDVTDVQVNGVSVVQDGVANVRVADDTTPGVVCVSSSYGIKIRQSSQATPYALSIDSADVNQIKSGANNVKPIVPSIQHASTFYGLAKAAGADMASSSNAVGTYTDAAKVAIQKMLGIYEAPWELIREDTGTNATSADVEIGVDGNGNSFELTDIRIVFSTPTQDNAVEVGTYGRICCYYNSVNSDTLYIGAYTQAAQATGKLSVCQIIQNGGMIERTVWKNINDNSDRSPTSLLKVTEGATTLFEFDKKTYTKVVIMAVTGTWKYKLYGKRKWN